MDGWVSKYQNGISIVKKVLLCNVQKQYAKTKQH
jgi:hypothetical protein